MNTTLAVAFEVPLPFVLIGGFIFALIAAEVVFGFFYGSN